MAWNEESARDYFRKRGAERRAAGLCVSCNDKALPGESRCQTCKDRRKGAVPCSECGKRRKAMYEAGGAALCGPCVLDHLVNEGVIDLVGAPAPATA